MIAVGLSLHVLSTDLIDIQTGNLRITAYQSFALVLIICFYTKKYDQDKEKLQKRGKISNMDSICWPNFIPFIFLLPSIHPFPSYPFLDWKKVQTETHAYFVYLFK